TSGARRVLDAIQEIHRMLAEQTGGRLVLQLPDALITPHPLGGCCMGQTREEGVVDHRGAVFGYENLYVADGSIMPKAIGHNPSKTIAALSERMAQIIVNEGR
ncbi:MAG: GMC family oxidoreductase, partial [Anaerolineales bacterium]